jgi:hypothetical protein
MKHIISSKANFRLCLLFVTVAGALVFAVAPKQGALATLIVAIGVALFLAEIGLGIADHLRSPRNHSDD